MNKYLGKLSLIGVFAMTSITLQAKQVQLTNKDDKAISVELVSATDDAVTFKMGKNRKTMTLPISELSPGSQALVKDWKKKGGGLSEEYEIKSSIRSSSKKKKSTGKKVQPVDITIKSKVEITNGSRDLVTGAAKATVIVLGRAVAKSRTVYVFHTQSKKLPAIEPGESFEFEIKDLKDKYLDDKDKSYGAKYSGYAVIIEDADGEVIASKSMPSSLIEKYSKELLTVEQGEFYNSDFTPSLLNDKKPKK